MIFLMIQLRMHGIVSSLRISGITLKDPVVNVIGSVSVKVDALLEDR